MANAKHILEGRPQPKRILIVKPSSLGDVVHGLALLDRISECFPQAEIDWVVARGLEGLLEDHPLITRLWVIDKDKWKRLSSIGGMLSELGNISTSMKARQYDLTIDIQGLFRSGVIAWLSGGKIRLGLGDAREGSQLFYTHVTTPTGPKHAVDRYLDVARHIGCPATEVRFPLLIEPYDLEHSGQYAVIVPGARWQTKRWPPRRFGELAASLPMQSFIVGSQGDAWLADTVARNSKGMARSLAGKTTLKELASVLNGASFVVTNDTGTMHMAAGLQRPVIAIFGPTDPNKTGPYGSMHSVLTKSIPCSPCRKKDHCPELHCMNAVTVDDVIAKLTEKGLI